MLINLIKDSVVIRENLPEPQQDMEWLLLKDHPQGLVCCGLATCYAVIIKSPNNLVLAHVSSYGEESVDFFKDMLRAFARDEPQNISVIFGRCPESYTLSSQEDKEAIEANGQAYDEPDATTFFAVEDQNYRDMFKKHFKFLEKPQFLTMPNDLLVIEPNGELQLFENYKIGEIIWRKAIVQNNDEADSDDSEMQDSSEEENEQEEGESINSESSDGQDSSDDEDEPEEERDLSHKKR